MKDKHDLVRGWLSKAASDLTAASHLLETTGPYDTVCFHAQQSIEKVLKAFLAFHEVPIPKTHDLEMLQKSCLTVQTWPALEQIDLTQVTDYAVAVRYDLEFWPDQATAAEAVTVAELVQSVILEILPPESRP